jgi:undecaprenyl-diphosphatase
MTAGGSLRDKLTTEERYVAPEVRRNLYVSAYLLMGVGTALFVSLVVQVMDGIGIVNVDHQAEAWFVGIRTPALTTLDEVLAVVFGPVALPIIVLLLTVGWIFFSKHAWRPLVLAGAMTLGVVLIQILTRLVHRARPPVDLMLFGKDATYSFPSGHVSGTAGFFLLVSYLVISRRPTRLRTTVAVVIAVVGIGSQVFSRLYLGYHWLSDTLASICVAMVVLGLVIAVDTRRTVRVPGEKVTGELSKVQTDDT